MLLWTFSRCFRVMLPFGCNDKKYIQFNLTKSHQIENLVLDFVIKLTQF